MATRRASGYKQKGYVGRFLVALGLIALTVDLSILLQPFGILVFRLNEGLLGVIPTLGMRVLNATHALAFHQVNYISLAAWVLVSCCAMASIIAGFALLWPKAKRVQIIELMLSPELEEREITNGSSR